MEGVRSLLRRSLRESLGGLQDRDRLDAAWAVACGRAMSAQGEIVEFSEGVVWVEVAEVVWLGQMRAMGAMLRHELARIAGVEVKEIHFTLKTGRSQGVVG